MEDRIYADEQHEGFLIDDDLKADWAVRKIAEARDTRDRRVAHYKRQIELAEYECQQTEDHMTGLLVPWLDTVPAKKTKTQLSYQLPSGKVTLKQQNPEYKRDEAALAAWMKQAGYQALVKVKTVETPDWAALKKDTVDRDGHVFVRETGELVEGVTAIERGAKLIVEV